jgi:hypothetical protein
MCGIQCKSRSLVFEEQSASCSNCDQQLCTVQSWTTIVYEGIQDPGNRTQYSLFVLVFLCLCLMNCCTFDVGIIASVWGLPNLLQVCEACPTYCKCVRPSQLIASMWGLPNLLQVCEACPTYCKCVRPAQLLVLTEVRAPSLWEQHPWYVPHRDRPGYNKTTHKYALLYLQLKQYI